MKRPMEVVNVSRGKGKTNYAIMRSHVKGYPILCATKDMALLVEEKAKSIGLDIPKPIAMNDLRGLIKPKKMIVDEVGIILRQILGCDIDTITMSELEE